MKTSLITIACFALLIAACGEDGPTCKSVCAKMVECQIESSQDECMVSCEQMEPVMRPAVFKAMGDCFLDADCAALKGSEETCMLAAMAEADPAAGARMVAGVCDKMVECQAYASVEACLSEMEATGGDTFEMAGMFKDSVIGCAIDCFAAVDCADLQTATEDCFDQCGLGFGEDAGPNE